MQFKIIHLLVPISLLSYICIAQAQTEEAPTFIDLTPPERSEPLNQENVNPADSSKMGDPDPIYPQEVPPPTIMDNAGDTPANEQPVTPSEPATVETESLVTPAPEVTAPATPEVKLAAPTPSAIVPSNDDEPNVTFEGRLHETYKMYNEVPTSAEKWDAVVGARKSEVYQIQSGDTLWDLSQTLFGDANYWPKVWSLNTQITNPHLISVGQAVQFYPGTSLQPPTLEVAPVGAPAGPGGTPAETPLAPVLAASGEGLPPTKMPIRPLVKKLPRVFSIWHIGAHAKLPPEDVHIDLKPKKLSSPQMILETYVGQNLPQGAGQVVEIESGDKSASSFQYIFVKLRSGATVGDRYYVAKDLGRLKSDFSDRIAHMVQIQGEIEIVDMVNVGQSLYRAMVTESVTHVEVGSSLYNGAAPTYNVGLSVGEPQDRKAKIIGGGIAPNSLMYSEGMMVFLDQGTRDGLTEGMVFNVYADQRTRNPNTKLNVNERKIGVVKTVRADEQFATAVVLQASEPIRKGDQTTRDALLLPPGQKPTDDSAEDLNETWVDDSAGESESLDFSNEPEAEEADSANQSLEEEFDQDPTPEAPVEESTDEESDDLIFED